MESKNFYKHVDTALSPECRRLGFKRVKRTTSLWMRDMRVGTLIYEIAKSPHHAYVPYLGGRFGVRCDLTSKPDVKSREQWTSISYMQYYDAADLNGLAQIRDSVLQKIISQNPKEQFDISMLATYSPMIALDIGRPFHPNAVFTLPYLDFADVDDWGAFLAARLEKTIRGIDENPVFLMPRI